MGSGDAFGEVLAALRFSSQLYFRATLGSPFALAVPAAPGVIRFHARAAQPPAQRAEGERSRAGAASTGCTLEVADAAPVSLGPGDLVLVPHGAAHVLRDDASLAPTPLDDALGASGFDGAGPFVFGGDGPETVLACGHFAFDGALLRPLSAALPPVLHVRADPHTSYSWIEPLLQHVEREARSGRAGSAGVVRRLSEILCIELLRVCAARGGLGVLSALADPQLGRALRALHAEPEARWSLEGLARRAGLSRTLFVERFRERVGVSPMRYLAACRMERARALLERPECSVSEVARRVGYASESAFTRTFRAQFGAPPGAYRRAEREA